MLLGLGLGGGEGGGRVGADPFQLLTRGALGVGGLGGALLVSGDGGLGLRGDPGQGLGGLGPYGVDVGQGLFGGRIGLGTQLGLLLRPAPVLAGVAFGPEKLHAMLRDSGERANTRVRDLVDLVIMIEHRLLDPATVADAARQVWGERDAVEPPAVIPPLPESWPDRYVRLTADHDLEATSFPAAVALVDRLWADMFPTQEN